MVVFKIVKLLEVVARATTPEMESEVQKRTVFPGRLHPAKPQTGSIRLLVKKMGGNPEGISSLMFIDGASMSGTLQKITAHKNDRYELDIELDGIFQHGIQHSMMLLLPDVSGILGFEANEIGQKTSIQWQRSLLESLCDLVLPKKKDEICSWAIPGFLLIPDNNTTSVSCLLGPPKVLPGGTILVGNNGKPMCHIAGIQPAEFTVSGRDDPNLFISFYLSIISPAEEDALSGNLKGAVLHGSQPATLTLPGILQFDPAVPLTAIPFLDIPGEGHSLMRVSRWSDDQRQDYSNLLTIYKELILPGMDEDAAFKWGGYPVALQQCVAFEAEVIAAGTKDRNTPLSNILEWQLMLQIPMGSPFFSFTSTFGDAIVYFMIKQGDLIANRYEKAVMVVQCT